MKRFWPAGVIVLALSGSTIAAMDVEIGSREVEAALSLARSTDAARAAFHKRYIFVLNDATVERIEVITETRRLVQIAEGRIATGDRLFGSGTRAVQEALQQWRRRVAIVAQLRFHPQNTYVGLPMIAVTLQTASGDVPQLDTHIEPILSLSSGRRGERLPVLGARAEGVFDSTGIARMSGTAIVEVDGKELVRAPIDFSRLQ